MPSGSRTEFAAHPPGERGTAAHSLTAEALLALHGTDRRSGLSSVRADELRARWGPNVLDALPAVPWWRRFARQFRSLTIGLLLVASAVSAAMRDAVDAVAILAIVLLNGFIGFLQEERAARAVAALEQLAAPLARTIRDGVRRILPAAEVVPGDLLEVEAGDRLSADARLIESAALRTDESALTGESAPVGKTAADVLPAETPLADRSNCVFMGTLVVGGRGLAVVTATGMATGLGRIAGLVEHRAPRPTPLQRRMDQLGRLLVWLCLGIIGVIAGLQWLRGGGIIEVFVLAVSLAVSAVPEGLPAVVTVALALGLQRVARRRALVRRMPSLETLGSVHVVCTDKTGTLTRNEMTVRELVTARLHAQVTGAGYAPVGEFLRRRPPVHGGDAGAQPPRERLVPSEHPELLAALTTAARCNDARLQVERSVDDGSQGEARWTLAGDPTEGALLSAALKAGIPDANRDRDIVHEQPFDPARRSMSVAVREPDGSVTLHVKGAPEVVLARCDRERVGSAHLPLTDRRRRELASQTRGMAARALRVLALAQRPGGAGAVPDAEADLVFVGLVGMIDPPRPGAAAALARCRRAGIRAVMITGDHPATAASIAHELGIVNRGSRVATGPDLDALDDAALVRAVADVPVYARVTAEHKLRVVRAWRARGAVVAMTGDGANDAPALRLADVGIAMGRRGTDVAREVADLILLDDDFSAIVSAIEEGRGVFDNIQRVVHYLLATNAGEVLLLLFAALAGWPVPLMATQLLWINLVTDGLPALALGAEPTEPGVMDRPPHERSRPILSSRDGLSVALCGALVALVAGAGFAYTHAGDPAQLPHARAVAFSVVAYAQLLLSFTFRNARWTLFALGPFTNPGLLAAVCGAGLLQFAALEWPLMHSVFGMSRPLGSDWGVVALLALIPVTIVELLKLVRGAVGGAQVAAPAPRVAPGHRPQDGDGRPRARPRTGV